VQLVLRFVYLRPFQLLLTLSLLIPLADTAGAAETLINNGLAPPNSLNVIDAADDYAGFSGARGGQYAAKEGRSARDRGGDRWSAPGPSIRHTDDVAPRQPRVARQRSILAV
jgi:hypothetical protein